MSAVRYAVIGSNCFTGSHLVDALLQRPGTEVFGVSRSPENTGLFLPYKRRDLSRFKFFQVDLYKESGRLINIFDDLKPDHVINVSALSEVGLSNHQPIEYYQVNTMGVVALCHQLKTRSYLKRYVQISTPEIYGSCDRPLDETAPYNPSTPYAASKAAGDMYLQTIRKNFDFPAIFIRSTNVYGRHQQLYKIIPRTVIYLRKNQKIELHGGGNAVKTWVHIRDVVSGVLLAIESGRPGEVYHFGDQHSMSISDLVGRICALCGRDFASSVEKVGERLGQDARYILDYAKSQRELGWSPRVSFEEGVREVITWVEGNWDAILREPLVYVHKV